jgi:hypothetical protein
LLRGNNDIVSFCSAELESWFSEIIICHHLLPLLQISESFAKFSEFDDEEFHHHQQKLWQFT